MGVRGLRRDHRSNARRKNCQGGPVPPHTEPLLCPGDDLMAQHAPHLVVTVVTKRVQFSPAQVTAISGIDNPLLLYKWDLSAIVKDASLLSDNVDTTRQSAPKIKDAPRPRIPPGFFDGTRRADLSTSYTQSHGQQDSRTLSRFPSFWRRHQHRATGHHTQSWSSPFSWTQNLVSGTVRRRDGSDAQLREPPIVEVPCTAGKPRNYHAWRKKPTASSSQTAHAHPTQQPPPNANATASTPPAVAGATGTAGTITRPHIPITGWRTRLMAWVCCMPVQNAP
ncbi:hypothetical protein DEU56DRAFT_981255 [Suillus clintonianus]|uniref:uncharacterized protein n=1 Tax=Suillus clintonianus TaxID=1904413 RepID=UPI001B86F129|nr:uncharacterized protein DEU56DRAFT_981255 [Suillus clintonianus]KAG2135177.1 hypothetical protein DEU56DRAFT_981255 [Suillus clintonianus]